MLRMRDNGNMRTRILAILTGMLLVPSCVFAATTEPTLKSKGPAAPAMGNLYASAVVYDMKSGKELYKANPNLPWSAASLTKLMGALVAIDQKPNWNRIVSILKADEVGGGRLRVDSGSTLSLQDVLFSSIVGSANNAAMALARTSGLSSKAFIANMNKKAKALGMTHSTFADPAGMDPANIVTAEDLVKLAKAAFSTPIIQKAASTPTYSFVVRNYDYRHTIKNTDHLLTSDPDVYVYGGKTGFLNEARNNLIVELRGNDAVAQPTLLVVVLGAPDEKQMFGTAKGLAEWAWKAYSWPSAQVHAALTTK